MLLAHKWILAAQSQVLRAEFIEQQEREGAANTTATVMVPSEFTVQAVSAILHYCYYGYLDDRTMWGSGAEEIYELAQHYGMDELAEDVELSLSESITEGNRFQRLQLACKHSADVLEKVGGIVLVCPR